MLNLQPIDRELASLLRKNGRMSVTGLAAELRVTGTAVRQRLARLIEADWVTREAITSGRGRPRHEYSLTKKGRRQSGNNFADLAVALWDEIQAISDPEVRRGLLQRLALRLANTYEVAGESTRERMKSVADLFEQRQIPISVGGNGDLPVLTTECCPYPDLAEKDRSVCAMEKLMLSELVGQRLRLSECRLDGGNCCTFEVA